MSLWWTVGLGPGVPLGLVSRMPRNRPEMPLEATQGGGVVVPVSPGAKSRLFCGLLAAMVGGAICDFSSLSLPGNDRSCFAAVTVTPRPALSLVCSGFSRNGGRGGWVNLHHRSVNYSNYVYTVNYE